MKLKDKTAIITGGANGIGRATAVRFAQEGASIVVCDINLEEAHRTADEIKSGGGEAMAVQADVRSSREIAQMVSAALDAYGGIDILVNNAGGASRGTGKGGAFHTVEEELIDRVIDINLKGVLLCSRAVLQHMMDRGSGKIVNMASITGVVGSRNAIDYAAAKGGVIAFTKSLGMFAAPYGINVNCVSPGAILTRPGLAQKQTYLGRTGEPEEVAGLVLFLSSSEADFITAQNYIIDGGRCWGAKE